MGNFFLHHPHPHPISIYPSLMSPAPHTWQRGAVRACLTSCNTRCTNLPNVNLTRPVLIKFVGIPRLQIPLFSQCTYVWVALRIDTTGLVASKCLNSYSCIIFCNFVFVFVFVCFCICVCVFLYLFVFSNLNFLGLAC